MKLRNVMKADFARWFQLKMLVCVGSIIALNTIILFQNLEGLYSTNVVELVFLYMNDPFFVVNFILIAAFTGIAYCDERESGYYVYWIQRCSVKNYVISKMLNCYLGSLCILPSAMFVWICGLRLFLPWVNKESDMVCIVAEQGMGNLIQNRKYLLYYFLYSIGIGMMAGVLSMGTFLTSLFIQNKILVQVVSAVLFYMNVSYMGDISEFFRRWSLEQIFYFPANNQMSTSSILAQGAIYSVIVGSGMGVIAYWKMKRSCHV